MSTELSLSRIDRKNKFTKGFSDFVSIVIVISELLYTILIFLYSQNPYLTLALCVAMPLINGPASALSALTKFPFYYISLTISYPVFFSIIYFAGAGAPGWLFALSFGIGIILAVQPWAIRSLMLAATAAVTVLALVLINAPLVTVITVVVVFFIFCLALWRTYAYLSQQNDALSDALENADRLLLSILPSKIAERMKSGEKRIADKSEHVTIVFIDLVGFTTLSQTTAPEKLIDILDTIFSSFDELAEKYGLEKIKTIGDAYMLASGIPDPVDAHASAAVKMVLEARDRLAAITAQMGVSLPCRIGVHCGPIIAGVIGQKKFSYDVWGDVVNVASRMESQGESGKIQCSEAVYALLKDEYRFTGGAEIEVRGKGMMRTYYLEA